MDTYQSVAGAPPPSPPDFAEQPLPDLLCAACARDPHAAAIRGCSGPVIWADFLRQILAAAHRIATLVPAGGVLATLVPRTPDGLATILGCLVARRIAMVLDPAEAPARSMAILADANPTLVVVTDEAESALPPGMQCIPMTTVLDAKPDPAWTPPPGSQPDEPALVHFTSGSSGRPKGIVTSLFAALRRAQINADAWMIGPGDRLLATVPISANAALSHYLGALLWDAELLLHETGGADQLLAILAAERPTILHVGPALLRSLVRLPGAAEALRSVRVLQTGGAGMLGADIVAARAVLPPACSIRHTYASTEAGIVAHHTLPAGVFDAEPRVPGGLPLDQQACTLLGPDGQPAAPGEPGELVVSSRCVALGEWRDGRCVPGRMTPDPARPGWRSLHTGDLMRIDAGLLRFVSRADQQIKINGVRIDPGEIEAVLRSDPALVDAAVIARPRNQAIGDPELALAAFVAAPGHDPARVRAALMALTRRELPPVMRPAHVVVLDALPRLASGKLDQAALPEPVHLAYQPPRDEREDLLCRLFAELTGADVVSTDDSFFALGGDSIAAMRLVVRLHEETGYECPIGDIYLHPTPAELVRHLVDDGGRTHRAIAAPALNDLPPAHEPAIRSNAELVAQFENLGRGCEFGFLQREVGAEPIGLLRFAGMPLEGLIAGLESQFAGIDEPDDMRLTREDGKYMVQIARFSMTAHTGMREDEITPAQLHRIETRKLRFLADRLIEDLELASKIFVYHQREPLHALELIRLRRALGGYGRPVLLYVTEADSAHPAGSVERIDRTLMVGYLASYAPAGEPYRPDVASWIELCRNAYRIRWADDFTAYDPAAAAATQVEVAFGRGGTFTNDMGRGWSYPEDGYTWAVGKLSTLVLDAPAAAGHYVLNMAVRPYLYPPAVSRQALILIINGQFVRRFDLNGEGRIACHVPARLLLGRDKVEITFRHPDAACPAVLADGKDVRHLAVAFRSVILAGRGRGG